ncbi:hypothetical protein BJF93_20345 [Xaviernesmea oryzae]|uniref:Uncharacterized protein n=1 Tax=Xaviernesmea oryzae TaxID=464029 RepID=A0A1Q9AVU5_9HYPH|nr:DUF6030 family protein [Xaviernesmea oryzae]OLP59569.1 hypothetical protein BJF93_20345 [Xaviernesmea oryzae]SEM13167.1 hypothetical protein SAMN04487976_12038 [Xaviernesmea oryzae]
MDKIRERKRKSRSARNFFFIMLLFISLAIGLTVLLAEDMRNLKFLMARFGLDSTHVVARLYELTSFSSSTPPEASPLTTVRKSERLAALQIRLPSLMFRDLKAPQQSFLRRILDPPAGICQAFDKAGFNPMAWEPSAEGLGGQGASGFECSVIMPVGKPPLRPSIAPSKAANALAEEDPAPEQSSVFIYVHGPRLDAFDTFRIKMNIEHPEDREAVLRLASRAAALFFKQVQWEDAGDIASRILHAEEFDQRKFGSRLQLKKEFGETPRYNFLAAEARRSQARAPSERFFDREQWLPLFRDGLLFTKGTVPLEHVTGGLPHSAAMAAHRP